MEQNIAGGHRRRRRSSIDFKGRHESYEKSRDRAKNRPQMPLKSDDQYRRLTNTERK